MPDTHQILPHLPPILRDFCTQTQESLNLDPLAPILPMLSIASAAIGNSRPLAPTPDLLIRPVLWSALLSPKSPRYALIFHLLDSPKPAEETTVPTHQLHNAITVLEFFLHHTIHLHATLPQLAQNDDPDFDHHLHIIRSLGGVITPRQLVHSSRFFRSSTSIAVSFLQSLEKAGLGQITWPHHNGRPSMLFKLFDPVNGNKTPRSTPKNRVPPKPKHPSHKHK